MEISVSGLANLEPPKPAQDNAAVRAMMEGPNAKKKGECARANNYFGRKSVLSLTLLFREIEFPAATGAVGFEQGIGRQRSAPG
jgi:hypothetical protein